MEADSDAHVLSIERAFPAPVARVFAAVSQADQVAQWWGPLGFTIPRLEFEPEVGAGYTITMQPPEGDAFYLRGRFETVEPPHRLSFTFEWDPADPDDVETVADLSFESRGDSTQLAFTQGPFKTAERLDLHRGGWTDSLDKLERFLASG